MSLSQSVTTKRDVNLAQQANRTETSSSTKDESAAPVLQAFEQWATLPQDINHQIIYWLMLKERSLSGAPAFASTCKIFYQSAQNFLEHPLCASAQASLFSSIAADSVSRHLSGLLLRNSVLEPKTPKKLGSGWWTDPSGRKSYLLLNQHSQKTLSDPGFLQYFRAYQGNVLSLSISYMLPSYQTVTTIAAALPARTNLDLLINPINTDTDGAELAKLITTVCSRRRISSIQLHYGLNSAISAAPQKALLDALCGDGLISFAECINLDHATHFLQDLAARFQELRQVRLLSIYCRHAPKRAVLAALMEAVKQRQASGQAQVTVVLGGFDIKRNVQGFPLFSNKEQQRMESFGLFFGSFDNGTGHLISGKILDSAKLLNSVNQVQIKVSEEKSGNDEEVCDDINNDDAYGHFMDFDDMNDNETEAESDEPQLVARKNTKKRCAVM
jgi:hypothetical protein